VPSSPRWEAGVSISADKLSEWLDEVECREGHEIVLLACFPGEKRHETALHNHFAPYSIGNEWYAMPIDDARAIVKQALEVA
jgi:hypothetical protein